MLIALIEILFLLASAWTAPVVADPLDPSLAIQGAIHEADRASQAEIDQLSAETDQMLAQFRETLQRTERLRSYNAQLSGLLESQAVELESLKQQGRELEVTKRDILPLLARMVDRLDQFVSLDLPFLPHERQRRLNRLRDWLARSDVSIASKYKRVMEAYQIESEYGQTLEAYRGALRQEQPERSVEFLRIGRLALLYLTLDGSEGGQWNRRTNAWQVLRPADRRALVRGLRVAKRQTAPELLVVPIPAPEDATP